MWHEIRWNGVNNDIIISPGDTWLSDSGSDNISIFFFFFLLTAWQTLSLSDFFLLANPNGSLYMAYDILGLCLALHLVFKADTVISDARLLCGKATTALASLICTGALQQLLSRCRRRSVSRVFVPYWYTCRPSFPRRSIHWTYARA